MYTQIACFSCDFCFYYLIINFLLLSFLFSSFLYSFSYIYFSIQVLTFIFKYKLSYIFCLIDRSLFHIVASKLVSFLLFLYTLHCYFHIVLYFSSFNCSLLSCCSCYFFVLFPSYCLIKIQSSLSQETCFHNFI